MFTLAMIGELLIGLFFAFMGVYNVQNRGHLVQSLQERGHKVPEWAVMVGAVLEVLGGVMVIFHYAPKLATIYLMAFTIFATYLLHPFWTVKGRDMWKHLLVAVNNLAIVGALLLILSMRG